MSAAPELPDPDVTYKELIENGSEYSTALATLDRDVSLVDETAPSWVDTADLPELASGLHRIREIRQFLGRIESWIESKTAQSMTKNDMAVAGWILKRQGGNKRSWSADGKERVLGRAIEAAYVTDDGEVSVDIETAYAVRDLCLQILSGDPRVTPLKALGVEFSDLCETEKSRRTVQVVPAVNADPAVES